ncbi:hypothetical protein ABZ307_16510 [Streptomyces griseorubiginosus]|uniref:hypothetical protein n=1 Tax=Streptomyces griseorubiginosus TaxID=67304 RepID=UPI0033B25CC8
MSVIVEFFLARDDASAALALPAGPDRAASLSYGNFDPEEAVVEWDRLLADGDVEAVAEADEPRVVAEQSDGGCVVFALSARLSTALAGAGRSRLRDVAAQWTARRAEEGEIVATEVADRILRDLAVLAGDARRQGLGVYCWVA